MSYATGPAALKIGSGPYIYPEAGWNVKLTTKTGTVLSDLHGELGKFAISRSATITGRPVGGITDAILSAVFPVGVGNVGASVLGATDQAVELWTKAGQKITWKRGGITKFPELTLSATKALFSGDIEVTCLGAASTTVVNVPTNAAHWQAITTAAFAETTFDPTAIKRYRYTAAYGDAPYDALTAQEGFKVSITQETEEIMDDNVGVADIVLKSITAACTFIPSQLTEAQVWALVNLQGAAAVLPGDLIAGDGATDLVISGADAATGFSLTLSKPGAHDASTIYGAGKLRNGEVAFAASRTFTAGAADPLFTFALS